MNWRSLFKREAIYIVPTLQGGLFGSVCLLCFAFANWGRREPLFIAVFAFITVGLLAMVMTNGNLSGLTCEVEDVDPVESGKHMQIPVNIKQRGGKPCLDLSWNFWQSQAYTDVLIEQSELEMELRQESPQVLGPQSLTVSSSYPMGLFFAWRKIPLRVNSFFYPKGINHLEDFPKGQNEGHQKHTLTQTTPGSSEFSEHSRYQHGDSTARIDWKLAARRDILMVRNFVEEDQTAPRTFTWQETDRLPHNQRIEQLSYWIQQQHSRHGTFGLSLPNCQHQPANGRDHLYRCLKSLTEMWQ